MAHKADEKQFPVAMRPDAIRELQKVAIDLQEYVPRSRAMNRGPMVAYVARWFLSLPMDAQLRIVRAGKEMSDRDVDEGAMAIVKAIDLDGIIGKLVERPATGAFWGGEPAADGGGEDPGKNVGKRLKGDDGAVGVRRKTPGRK